MIISLAYISIFSPLLASLYAWTIGKRFKQKLGFIYLGVQGIVFACSIKLAIHFFSHPKEIVFPFMKWIQLSSFSMEWGIYLDTLSIFFLCTIHGISFLIQIYSLGYMNEDPGKDRFFLYFNCFTSVMAFFSTSSSLIQLFMGWELIGILSFFLISFWHEKSNDVKGAIDFFSFNRIGGIFLLMGIVLLFFCTHSFSTKDILFRLSDGSQLSSILFIGSHGMPLLPIIVGCFIIAAMTKSAQFGFHSWLSSAMDAPTPVSAFLHSAAVVASGIFLLIRFEPLLESSPIFKEIILWIGMISAFYGATVAMAETNINRILAFSTISQMGFMMIAIGLGAYKLAFFYMIIHSFLKSLLFLNAGILIHASDNEKDILEMPVFKIKLPITYISMWIGTLSLCGLSFFSGFFVKEPLIELAKTSQLFRNFPGFWFFQGLSFLTALYSARLLFILFHSPNKAALSFPLKKISWLVNSPLIILTFAPIIGGYLGNKCFKEIFHFGLSVLIVKDWIFSFLISTTAFLLMGFLYLKYAIFLHKTVLEFSKIYMFFKSKWYLENFYSFIFIKPFDAVAWFFSKKVEVIFIESFCIHYLLIGIQRINQGIQWIQYTHMGFYVIWMVMGIMGLIAYLFSIK